MTKKHCFLLFAVLGTCSLLAQSVTEWQGQFQALTNRNGAIILQNDQTVDVFRGPNHRKLSQLGELVEEYNLFAGLDQVFFAAPSGGGLFYMRKFVGSSADELKPYFRFPDGIPVAFDPLPDEVGSTQIKPPACLQLSDTEYVVFGREFYRKFTIDPAVPSLTEDWVKSNGVSHGTDADFADGGFVVTLISDNDFSSLQRLDETGNLQWEKLFFGDDLLTVKTLPDGFLLGGSSPTGAFLRKTDLDGEVEWEQGYPDDSTAYEVIQTADDGFAFTGMTFEEELFVTKTDADGQVQWRTVLPLGREGHAIVERPFGGYVVAGRTSSSGTAFVAALGEEGEVGPPIDFDDAKRLDVNNISSPALFQNDFFLNGEYFFPKDSFTTTIFSSGLWLGGFDEQEQLHLMEQTYIPEDFEPGYPGGNPDFFNRTWSVSREIIERFREDLADGSLDRPQSYDLLTWPAKGNPNLTQAGEPVVIEHDLAPFIDVNGDGVYNPDDGDYPKIKGEKMLWWVFHDDTEHVGSGGLPLEVEVQCSFYAFGCTEEAPMYNTTFLEYKIVPHGDAPLDSVRAGLFYDIDLGCYADDFIGSIPDMDACFAYNFDVLDGDPECTGVATFGENVPIQSQMLLSHPMDGFMYFNNPSVGVPPIGTTDPQIDFEYYNYLNNHWKDGTPLTQGGDGYDPISSEVVSHAFPDAPDDVDGWSLCTVLVPSADIRALATVDLGTLLPGEPVMLRTAWVTTPMSELPCPPLDQVLSDLQMVETYDEAGWFELTNEIWETDTIYLGFSDLLDLPEGGEYLWSTGETGSAIQVGSDGWYEVEMLSPWGCSWDDEVYVVLLNSGTDEIQVPKIHLFPNPVNAGQALHVEPEVGAVQSIQLFDGTGRQWASHDLSSGGAVPTRGLPAGVYFAQIKIGEAIFWRKITVVD